jgi:hypothetical protein
MKTADEGPSKFVATLGEGVVDHQAVLVIGVRPKEAAADPALSDERSPRCRNPSPEEDRLGPSSRQQSAASPPLRWKTKGQSWVSLETMHFTGESAARAIRDLFVRLHLHRPPSSPSAPLAANPSAGATPPHTGRSDSMILPLEEASLKQTLSWASIDLVSRL